MVPDSPVDALSSHAPAVRPLVVEAVRSVHDRFAAAHQVTGSPYAMSFGTQWRDLLDALRDALRGRGYQTHKLAPAGYVLPVVNNCLLYVWRVPSSVDAVSSFASSPTRKNGFAAPPPDLTLFEPGFASDLDPAARAAEEIELKRMMRATGGTMPLVLVMVHSSPRQLQSITWAVAEFDPETGTVNLHGLESIWEPESSIDGAVADVESFDSGTPDGPLIELQEQEVPQSDA